MVWGTLRARLLGVALLCMVMGVVPVLHSWRAGSAQLARAERQREGLESNRAWLQLLAQAQEHRALSLQAGQAEPRAHAAEVVGKSLQQMESRLGAAGQPEELAAGVKRLSQSWALMQQQWAQGNSPTPQQSLQLHAAWIDSLFDELDALNLATGLLLESDEAVHVGAQAGLQEAPRAGEALSELRDLSRAALVDDIASMASAQSRYLLHSQSIASLLKRLPEGVRLAQAQQTQQAELRATLQKAAADPSFPLDELVRQLEQGRTAQSDQGAQLLDLVQRTLDQHALELRHQSLMQLALALALLLPAIGLLFWTLRSTLAALQHAVSVAESIAAGDLSVAVPLHRSDELGRLMQAIDQMRQRLHQMVQDMSTVAQRIQGAAGEISRGNEDLGQRTESASSRLQQTSASMEHLSAEVSGTASLAQQATEAARGATEVAAAGEAAVQQVIVNMEALNAVSGQIGSISELIGGIAFQTNLLALNAAVEAARAGEQGRGFSVVAAEVRALAQRCSTAAKEIQTLTRDSVERVKQGAHLAHGAGGMMQQMLQRARSVCGVVAQIEGKSASQRRDIGELTGAVQNVDNLTQQNAALVEQSRAAADALQEQAEALSRQIAQFRLV